MLLPVLLPALLSLSITVVASPTPAPAANVDVGPVLAARADKSARQQCQQFSLSRDVAGQDVELFRQRYVEAGTFVNLTSGAGSIATDKLPAFCRECDGHETPRPPCPVRLDY